MNEGVLLLGVAKVQLTGMAEDVQGADVLIYLSNQVFIFSLYVVLSVSLKAL